MTKQKKQNQKSDMNDIVQTLIIITAIMNLIKVIIDIIILIKPQERKNSLFSKK